MAPVVGETDLILTNNSVISRRILVNMEETRRPPRQSLDLGDLAFSILKMLPDFEKQLLTLVVEVAVRMSDKN